MSEFNKEDFKAECTRRREAGFVLKGKGTYDAREEIKDAGGIWDKMQKAWLMPDEESVLRFEGINEAPEDEGTADTERPHEGSGGIPDDAF